MITDLTHIEVLLKEQELRRRKFVPMNVKPSRKSKRNFIEKFRKLLLKK